MQISSVSWVKWYWITVKCINLYSWYYMTLLFNITETLWIQQMNYFKDWIIWQNRVRNIMKMIWHWYALKSFIFKMRSIMKVWHHDRLTTWCQCLSTSLQLLCLRQADSTVAVLEKQTLKWKIWFKYCHCKQSLN